MPRGQVGRHLCNNPLCCNPAHLAVGTHSDNMRDCVAAKRWRCNRLLTLEQAASLRHWYVAGKATSVELSRLFGISSQRVRHIARDEPYSSSTAAATPRAGRESISEEKP